MGMKSRWACGVLAALLAIGLNACVNSNNGVGTSNTGFMWVTTQGDQMVSAFNINLSTGAVSKSGNSVPTGANPSAMAISPNNGTLFVANTGNSTVSTYTVNSDGSLVAASSTSTLVTSPPGCTIACTTILGQSPVAMDVDPSGKFLFVADRGTSVDPAVPGTISVFSVSGTTLTPVGPACPANYSQTICPVIVTDPSSSFGTGPSAIAVSAQFLYVANQFNGTLSVFAYDSAGQLAPPATSPATYTVGANPSALAFSRVVSGTNRDNFLFVTNFGSDTVNIFNACVASSPSCTSASPTGLLTPVASVGAGSGPAGIVVDPALDFVYVLERKSSQVSEFTFSPATGGLSALSNTASVSGSPFAAGITSDGNWVFVSNNSGSNLSAFAVGANGVLNIPTTSSIVLTGLPSAVLIK